MNQISISYKPKHHPLGPICNIPSVKNKKQKNSPSLAGFLPITDVKDKVTNYFLSWI